MSQEDRETGRPMGWIGFLEGVGSGGVRLVICCLSSACFPFFYKNGDLAGYL